MGIFLEISNPCTLSQNMLEKSKSVAATRAGKRFFGLRFFYEKVSEFKAQAVGNNVFKPLVQHAI
jgi:hypothetical protein